MSDSAPGRAPNSSGETSPRAGRIGSFLDANVLVYLAQNDLKKAERVEALLALTPVISVQVLNELANVLRRNAACGWVEAHAFLDAVRALAKVKPLTVETHDLGLALAERYRLSTFDAMIAAAALLSDCDALWLEDMQPGLELDGRQDFQRVFGGNPAAGERYDQPILDERKLIF